MADPIELVIINPEEQANEITEGIPVTRRSIHTVNEFRVYFADLHAFISILLLFFHAPDQIIHPILKEIKPRKSQIIRVLICGDTNHEFVNNMYIRLVSEQMIKYKIKSTIARFIDQQCLKQSNAIDVDRALTLHQTRTQILEQFHTNDQLKACHILLIPLNATARDVHYAKQRMENICDALYGHEYRFVIRTLSDYIPEDETNSDKSPYRGYLEKRYRGKICHTIMRLSFIRMYVVGDELYILNKWSRKLVALELDINQEHDRRYVDRCSFIISRPVLPQFTGNLVPIFGRTWQMQQAVAKRLDDVRDDIYFQNILQSIHGCLENREMYVNSESYRQSLFSSGDITQLSTEIRPIEQARNSPEERQTTGDITNTIFG